MDEIEAEEYKVFSDLVQEKLSSLKPDQNLVIRGHTSTRLGNCDENLAEFLENQFGIRNVQAKNKFPHKLKNGFTLQANIVLISERELEDIFKIDGWETFRKKYGNCGITELSRVTFDKDKNFAVLSWGVQADYLMGYGEYIVMRKTLDKWKIEFKFPAWKS